MKTIYKLLCILGGVFVLIFAILGIYAYVCISKIDKLLLNSDNLLESFSQHLTILDDEENIVQTTYSNGNTVIKLEELPEYVKYAFISIEDKNFYEHNGLNLKRIIKSMIDNIFSGYAKMGASTISQQLIKNIHLSSTKSLERKIQEAYLTTKLEGEYTKDEILETYLNVIYFGNNCIGIESASQRYFGCSAKQLKLFESATLAGIIKSPSLFSPIENPENCLNRRNLVLSEMEKDGIISKEEKILAQSQDLGLKIEKSNLDNTAYLKECIKEAKTILNLEEKDVAISNYKIYTFLDQNTQNSLKHETKNMLSSLNITQDICVSILDNTNCGVVAYLSSTNFDIIRQPGSLIKPLLCYAPAFEEGILSPLTPIDDSSLYYDNWNPKNADNKFDGYISTREALKKSKNIPAIKTLEYVGIKKAKSYLENMGIKFDELDNHLALALGAMRYGVSPLQICSCYSTFANKGSIETYHFVKKIEDKDGKVVYEYQTNKKSIFSEETCYLINDILFDATQTGTAKNLKNLNIKVSAKTGTVGANDKNSDAWCISYNKNYTICSWIGNISNKEEKNLLKTQTGGTICAQSNRLAWQCVRNQNDCWFEKPESIKEVCIDLFDYQNKHILNLANHQSPITNIIKDIFNEKYIPKTVSSNYN